MIIIAIFHFRNRALFSESYFGVVKVVIQQSFSKTEKKLIQGRSPLRS